MAYSTVFILTVLSASIVSGFDITEVKPKTISVKEGDAVDLFCSVDGYYEWCTFKHMGKKCDYEWKREVWNLTVLDCRDYADRAEFTGDYNNYECSIRLSDVGLEDAGNCF